MAGHNKWTQIKRQKAVVDAKKSKLFSVLVKQIQLEARKANGDETASGLKTVIERARVANMPNENIERAIKSAVGAEAKELETILYEAYGPGGVALIIEAITNSRNRTTQEVKHLLAEHGGSLALAGAATWAFEKSAAGWQAKTLVPPPAGEVADQLTNLLAELNQHDDVERVSVNTAL
ncbi:MAG: YebC/PmpR family DNA-binding transcriptional regulator [Patescibacteria group bacterium]